MLSIEKIVSLCKQRGIVFQGSGIYGGLAKAGIMVPFQSLSVVTPCFTFFQ